MSRREVCWERMFPDELDAGLQNCPVLYLPYGLCEPHGPQNALGMDAMRAHGVACRAARAYGGIVAPPHYWHIHEHGISGAWAHPRIGQARPWLTALPAWMFFKTVCYHLRTADALGFKAAILYSGHAGPHSHDMPVLLSIVQPHLAARLLWVDDGGFAGCGYRIGAHGGKGETSILWALDASCVDVSRLPAPDAPGPHFAMGADARESNRRHGEAMVDEAVRWLGQKARELLQAYEALKPARKPLTFDDVEQIWEKEVRPRLKEFHAMKDLANGQEPPPKDSQWYANWHVPDRG